jgi:hypothetical protein
MKGIEMNKFKFEFTPEQINIIVAALGRMPYETVFALINDIQKQAQDQARISQPRDVGPPPD